MARTTTRHSADQIAGGSIVPADLFPLQVTPFEHYLLLEDTPERPMSSFFEIEFSTELNLGALKRSLVTAIHRNPFFASLIVGHGESWQWHYDPSRVIKIFSHSDTPPAPLGRPRHIDLTRECGIRVWYFPTDSGSRITLQTHHACGDGIGIRRLLVDMMQAYAQFSSDEQVELKLDKLDASLLKERAIFGSEKGVRQSTLTNFQRLRNAYYFFCKTPQTLVAPKQLAPERLGNCSEERPTCLLCIERQLSTLIHDKAQLAHVGINDLALALLFHTCWRWNEEFDRVNPRGRLRILMPFDLRSRVDFRMPATNRMSFAFLGRTFRQCHDWTQLLQSVQAETRAIKETHLSMDFLNGLTAAAKRPRLLRWLIGRSPRMATVILTYGGDVFRGLDRYFPQENEQRLIGDARVTSVFGAPPVRKGTNLSLGLCFCAGQLCISAAWSRDDLTREACELLLKRYAAAWHNWATRNHPDE